MTALKKKKTRVHNNTKRESGHTRKKRKEEQDMERGERGRERQGQDREGGGVRKPSQPHWTPLEVTGALAPYFKNRQVKGINK